MFYKRFDELSAILLKKFNTKKTILDTAQMFSELASKQNEENPFEYGMVALAYFGEMQCYEKLEDKQKIIQTSMKAARLFIKSASFNYEISRALRDSWSGPLANGIQCYRTASNTLISDSKPNLAVSILFELAQVESRFEFHHYAGNIYEEAMTFCIEHNLRPRLLLQSIINAIKCYSMCERFDLAYLVCEKGYNHFINNHSELIQSSQMMHEEYNDLSLFKSILMICNRKYEEAVRFSQPLYRHEISLFLHILSEALQVKQMDKLDELLLNISNFPEFNETHYLVLEKIKNFLSKTTNS